jgi:hypothetical protein
MVPLLLPYILSTDETRKLSHNSDGLRTGRLGFSSVRGLWDFCIPYKVVDRPGGGGERDRQTTYEGVSKSFRTESITKYKLTTINTR